MSMLALMIALSAGSAYPATNVIAGPPPPRPRALPSINPSAARDIREIRSEVREGRELRTLSRRQARELRRELNEISMLEDRYAAGGLSEAEQRELRARVEMVRALTRAKKSGLLR